MEKITVLYVTDSLYSYRIPFWKELNKLVDLEIIFTKIDFSKDIYGEPLRLKEIEGIKYEISSPSTLGGLLIKNFKRKKYDVVNLPPFDRLNGIICCYITLILTKVFQAKAAILWIRWLPKKSQIPLKKRIKGIFEYMLDVHIVRNCDICLCSGKKSYSNFARLGVKESNIRIIRYATDIDSRCVPCNPYEEYSVPVDKKIILFLGRLDKIKGLIDLIKAYEIIENKGDYILVIGGERKGEYYHFCKQYVEKKQLTGVYFIGKINSVHSKSMYETADIFVLPSIVTDGITEGWGQTLTEAIQSGCRVIASSATGAAEMIVNEDNGIVYESGNIYALKNAIIKMMNKKYDRNLVIESIKGFNCEGMAKDFLRAYQDIVRNTGETNKDEIES